MRELYLKLLEEHRLRAGSPSEDPGGGTRGRNAKQKPRNKYTFLIVAVILLYLLFQLFGGKLGHRRDGYYRLGERLFYRYGSSWYVDSDYSDWTAVDDFPADDYGSYYVGDSYDEDWGGSDFTWSEAWETLQNSDEDDDWDWDDDYDYDDWDSGDTDWDSDW